MSSTESGTGAKNSTPGRVFEITPIKVNEKKQGKLIKSVKPSDDKEADKKADKADPNARRDSAGKTPTSGKGTGPQERKAEYQHQAFLPKNIEGKQSQAQILTLKNKMKKYDFWAALVSVAGLIIAFVENEIFFRNDNKSKMVNYAMRGIVTLTCLLSMVFLKKHYQLKLMILKSKKIVYGATTLWSSPLLRSFLLEVVISWIHCPPGLDVVIVNRQLGIKFDISLDSYILFFMFLRLYVLFRLFDHYTIWTNPRALRVSKMNGFTADSRFAIKAYLKYKSFWVLSIGLGISVLLFGLWIRLFERSFVSSSRNVNFDYIWNSFWCVIVTMATIGYGDIYAKTHLGRFVSIGACIWGVFLLSLFVVIMNNYAEMTKHESTSYEEIERDKRINDKLRKEAAIVIQRLYRLRLMQKHNKEEKKKILLTRAELIRTVNNFKLKRTAIMSKNKGVNEIISDMQELENEEIHNLLRALTPVKSISVTIDQIQNLQYELNDCMVQVYENCQKMYSLAVESSKGTLGNVRDLNDNKIPQYDLKGREVYDQSSEPNYGLAFFRLKQESAQIGYSPLLKKAATPLTADKKPTLKLESAAANNNHIAEESSEEDSSGSDSEPKRSKTTTKRGLSQELSEVVSIKLSKKGDSELQRSNTRERRSSAETDQSHAESGIFINPNLGIFDLGGANLPGVVDERD